MTKLNAVIVDDERLARESLKRMLKSYPQVEVVGLARSASQARTLLRTKKPDVIFLDIHMPGESGFDILESLENPPYIVFVTAHDEYAIRAFEVNAVDYLLKPIETPRLEVTVQRVLGRVYHHLAVDLRSSYAVIKLYTARNAANAIDFLQNHLLAKAKNLGIHRLLQDNGTEFTAARWKDEHGHCNHIFHERAGQLGIPLTFIQPGHAWTNGSCERLHQTLLHEFYIPAMSRKIYNSLEELEYDLQLFLYWYNHQRTHQGYRLKGKTPAQVYFSGLSPQPGLLFKVHSTGGLSCLPWPPR
ncbi:MAG: hypothetical protein AUJ92_09105 [Armatimonadetes bacterium CG2_30_59_28]|nr:response regulator [Armatimonadota bacterium]OIO94859.1 MAG: hypothetical protein AUJ92_09105 [Armatimonadetes bacterium CG2_30_59_28]PIU65925.1 MAG: hypothetical protein COS85_07000 [Armatimonadetes bacterium CG07_land_8_20_14_0_80_59_28]PIY48258.1 MAG: hypothetical protein COZ05_03630 [Armatimonadetes bacterium CG_4_10_14_3_um_filter_59_10]PJB76784.1 MAG: hypothetical protein CO095_02130 [Armatimonadetes bacterium CG_4_9_14_3_um_filter_58_7]